MGNLNAAFAILLLMGGVLSAAMAVDSYTVTPGTLKPGEEGSVSFTIKNVALSTATAASPLEDVQVFYTAPAGLEYKTAGPFVVGSIDTSGSAPVSVPFRVLPGTKGGVIAASFYISQKDKTQYKTVTAVIKVVNPPIISLSSDHQAVESTDTINLTLKNNGGSASKVTLKLADSSNFTFMGTSEVYIGDIAGSATVQVPIDSRKVDEGVNSIPFVLSYQEEGGDTVNETKYLSVAVKKEKVDLVFTQADTVVTSRNNVLRLKVKNTGRALEDVKFYLEDEQVKAKESKLVRLGSLASGEEKEIAMNVFVDATPGVRNAAVTLKWVEDDVEKEESTAVQIFVNSDAEAAIFVDAKPAPIVVGGDHTLSILVSNVGSYKIQNVEVTLPDSGIFEIFNAQKSQYIGGLESDDFSTVQYKVRVKSVQPGTYPINVTVRYKDQSGIWVEKNQTASILVRLASDVAKGDSGGGILLAVVVLAAAAGGAYWYFRIRKPKKH